MVWGTLDRVLVDSPLVAIGRMWTFHLGLLLYVVGIGRKFMSIIL